MCGLAGILEPPGERASPELLLTMAGELRHRGPDGTGLYLDGRFGMTNTRLAIVDVEGGEQPLGSEDGRFWVMQNGEIYNHLELRRELEGCGHRFSTACDTEVLVHAYEEWGSDCLRRLNGDFAFAVWDRREQELFLARDRFGVRPLFLAELGKALLFASEAKALLRHPLARREIEPLALVDSFTTWGLSGRRSLFRGIRELPPAHFLRLGPDGRREERRWWELPFPPPGGGRREPPGELADEVRALLDDATRLRLRADVPVGAYISGGLDSSAIAALARRHVRGPLVSFGVGFADERFDESRYQDRLARQLGTALTRITVAAADIAELLPRAVCLAEQPTLRTALAPMLRLSQAVQDAGIKVVLTGEGADELFAGYDIFRENKLRRFWARDPTSRLRPLLLARAHPYLERELGRSPAFLRSFFARGLTETDDPLYSHRVRFANTARCLRVLSPDLLASAAAEGDPLTELRERLPPGFAGVAPLGQAQTLEIETFLTGYLLHAQGDRMLMGHGIEGRFPFLDHRVAELAAELPDSLRMRGLEEKHLLRRAVSGLLPEEISSRPKVPYRAPILRALIGPAAPDYVAELLQPARLEEAGLLSSEAVRAVVRKCRENVDRTVSETDEMALVGIVSTMLLYEGLVARPTLAPSAEPSKVVLGGAPKGPQSLIAVGGVG